MGILTDDNGGMIGSLKLEVGGGYDHTNSLYHSQDS